MTEPSPPTFAIPPGACDCHMHVFGPHDRYPLSPARTYTPPEAALASYRKMAARLGLARVVFVQPSPYGADNRCMLDAISAIGPNARGVAVIGSTTNAETLVEMHNTGVRGVRVNAESFGTRDAGAISQQLESLARRIAPRGWHIQIFAALDAIVALAPALPDLGVDVVIDHMGLASAARGLGQPGLDRLLRLVADGVWIKLSGADRISQHPDLADAAPVARALIAANPDRVIWGSDWPHTGLHAQGKKGGAPLVPFRSLDDCKMLSLLGTWTDDALLHKRIMTANPARLYGFEAGG